jgi:hypothetical protein
LAKLVPSTNQITSPFWTNYKWTQSFKISPKHNNRVGAIRFVTIFAPHHDNFIMTKSFLSVYQFQDSGSGQFLPRRQVILSPGLAKIATWLLARRDSFSAKAPGQIAKAEPSKHILIIKGKFR